jgi:single-strand DNA-binding protein
MMNIKNRVQLIGNLGATPEIKSLDNGNKMAKFAVATSDSYLNKKGEKVTETQWHNIIVWGKLAEIAEKLLDKGSHVALEGKLTTRNYTDKDGVKKYFTEIIAHEFLLMDRKENA